MPIADGVFLLAFSILPSLLRLYWVLCTMAAVLALLPLPGLAGFRAAVILSACRGKLVDMKPHKAFGPLSVSLLALCLLEVHLVRRYLETVLIMQYPPNARMHGIAYLYGISYYLVVPATLVPLALLQRLADGGLESLLGRGAMMGALPSALEATLARLSALQWLGVLAFVAGNLLQLHSHRLLANLSRGTQSGTYRIPRGGLFELVSCPHYLAEIVIYSGLGLLIGAQRPLAWLILAWVAANLVLAAGMTQAWYRRRFPSYPSRRKALFPWLY
ncbi:hypothetical protein APUTEX25_003387 [Auxenochlorella protothecoides]|uniref:3-oxo-5-alpha-steroid 4-dehydrogenase C-terminal domain-containing protein n=1 Tax=Auxenochlorella protothecoides TaxID=3075 RepID=A0A3M7KV12_AUXPR|nr:hypothetical protein APUTEX25_003387 [Auxenochlorella protothecoides]|eukprot:RMZ53565.1 hypothetical protein APUTEX25_003387 [Auxenochlorella protothecoides]